jgi:energy-coupling factor transporter transmembrane protein EcfT
MEKQTHPLLRAAQHWWGYMSSAVFTVLGLVSAGLQKSFTWQVKWCLGLAVFFLVVAFIKSPLEERQKNWKRKAATCCLY